MSNGKQKKQDMPRDRLNVFDQETKDKYANLLQCLDDELILAHLGTIDSFEGPKEALHALCCWHQDVGRYFATRERHAETKEA